MFSVEQELRKMYATSLQNELSACVNGTVTVYRYDNRLSVRIDSGIMVYNHTVENDIIKVWQGITPQIMANVILTQYRKYVNARFFKY